MRAETGVRINAVRLKRRRPSVEGRAWSGRQRMQLSCQVLVIDEFSMMRCM